MVAISSGGRLSTTNHPRSSRDFRSPLIAPRPEIETIATSAPLGALSPAPPPGGITGAPTETSSALSTRHTPSDSSDGVVMAALAGRCFRLRTRISDRLSLPRAFRLLLLTPVVGVRRRCPSPGRCVGPVQRIINVPGCHRPDARHAGDLLDVSQPQSSQRSEMLDQCGSAGFDRDPPLRPGRIESSTSTPLRAVVGDGEPMGLIAQTLQQVQSFAGAREDDRVVFARHPDLLQPFGDTSNP